MGIYVCFNYNTSCNYSRPLSIYLKTPEVSIHCDTSTSVARCFRNLDSCLLYFYCFVCSHHKLKELSKSLHLTRFSRKHPSHKRSFWIPFPYIATFAQPPHFPCCSKATKAHLSWNNDRQSWQFNRGIIQQDELCAKIFRRFKISQDICYCRSSVNRLCPSSNSRWPDVTWIL